MKETTFTFRVEPDLKARFEQAARATDRPVAQVLRQFMRDFVKEQETQAAYDAWKDRLIDEALRQADDPNTKWVPHEEVVAQMEREKAELLKRIKDEAK